MAAATADTVALVLRCLRVRSENDYAAICDAFDADNAARDAAKVELEPAARSPRACTSTIRAAC